VPTSLVVKWRKDNLQFCISADTTLGDLKKNIEFRTHVPKKRQKIVGIRGKPKQGDETLLSALKFKKLMLIGNPDSMLLKEYTAKEKKQAAEQLIDDQDIPDDADLPIAAREVTVRKLKRRMAEYAWPKLLNKPRVGKKLLVLDIDYTLFDHRSPSSSATLLGRPHLHAFLAAAYKSYDIVIWSATSMRWVEIKMKELGVLANPAYKIVCLMDILAMVTVKTDKYGVFNCKPLAMIWDKHEGYHLRNTIMFDDLRRNFILNPQNGLRIRPCRNMTDPAIRAADHELLHLSEYLAAIAPLADLSKLNHSKWKAYMSTQKRKIGSTISSLSEPAA